MKSYPSIDKKFAKKESYYFFDKLDGSNIRAEWSKKKGFYKFGSRNQLIDETHDLLGESVLLIKELEEIFTKIAKKEKIDRFIAFFEYYGENSFAGSHQDEKHKVVLFDVNIYKKGFMPPNNFVKIFENKIEIPKLLYIGKPTTPFLDSVKDGTLEGMTFEGVIGKRLKGKTTIDYFKAKNIEWVDRLKNNCGDNEALFNRLK